MSGVEHWNTNETTTLKLTVGGCDYLIRQEPGRGIIGTTVWDAGVVLAKYLAKTPAFFRGSEKRRVLELGAGCGVPGIFCAGRGFKEVHLTDKEEVLATLRTNVRLATSGEASARVKVLEYLWGTDSQAAGLEVPYDVVLAADCIYSMETIEPFLQSLRAVTDARSVVYVANEVRDELVTEAFLQQLAVDFQVKAINQSKLDPDFRHDLIRVYSCKRRKHKGAADADDGAEGDAAKSGGAESATEM